MGHNGLIQAYKKLSFTKIMTYQFKVLLYVYSWFTQTDILILKSNWGLQADVNFFTCALWFEVLMAQVCRRSAGGGVFGGL